MVDKCIIHAYDAQVYIAQVTGKVTHTLQTVHMDKTDMQKKNSSAMINLFSSSAKDSSVE